MSVLGGSPTSAAATGAKRSEAATRSAFDTRIRSNLRRRRLLLIGAAGVPGAVAGLVLGFAVGPVAGVVAAVVVAAAVAIGVAHRANRYVLRVIGGRRIDGSDLPRLSNLVEGLCATCGVRPPGLWLVTDPVPNACSVGRGTGPAALVVTSGLLDALDLLELEGVVAHELMHLKCQDAAVSEAAVAVLAPLVRITGHDGIVHRALGRGREYRADQEAVSAVRSPRGLQRALEAMAGGAGPEPGSVFTGRRWALTRWLWIDPMVGSRGGPTLGVLDDTEVRSAALTEW